jgi:hypothetical protein
MHARLFSSVTLAVAVSVSPFSTAVAGGGGHGGGMFHAGSIFHGGGMPGGWGGGARAGGWHPMPPIAGVIHERSDMRPFFSAYGHTNTAVRFGGFGRGGVPAYGHTATALPSRGGFRSNEGGYGHVGTAVRFGAERRFAALGEGRRRFAERGRFGGFGGGYGGFEGDDGFAGGYGFGGGTYGGEGTYGGQGTYGQPGTYGGLGGTATQGGYGGGDGGLAYRSETPLAARYAEPPLAPSPGAPYSAGDRYAYAASADVWPTPRVVNPYRPDRAGCVCGARKQPVVYRYGIGTAY